MKNISAFYLLLILLSLFPNGSRAALPERIEDVPIPNLTPFEDIFSVHSFPIPILSATSYTLSVTGLVDHPVQLTLDEIRSLPGVEIMSVLMCTGKVPIVDWIANVVWKGVRLSDVLDLAGIQTGASGIIEQGYDGFRTGLDKSRFPLAILAYEANGQVLSPTLGYPLRVIVPGIYGLRQAMWLRSLDIRDSSYYDIINNQIGMPPESEININSELIYPGPGTVFTVGEPTQVFGWSVVDGRVGVKSVEVSLDNQQTWHSARLYRNSSPYAWVLWGFEWIPQNAGPVKIWSRATDNNNESQPVIDTDYGDGYSAITSKDFNVVPRSADINSDGVVDVQDLFLFHEQWKKSVLPTGNEITPHPAGF